MTSPSAASLLPHLQQTPGRWLGRWRGCSRVLLCLSALWGCSGAKAVDCSVSKPESFISFFARFSADAEFAQARTEWPLHVRYWEPDGEDWLNDQPDPTDTWLSREAYASRPNLRSQAVAAAAELSVLAQTAVAATVKLSRRGASPSKLYHFRLEAGCWRLWEIDDTDG